MQHPFEHDITALAYDLVDGAEREQLLEHLASCDQCRGLYDSYRDEQVAVRDAIVRDARSGAAEAKALESTLRMLGGLNNAEVQAPKRGLLLRWPAWLIAAEVAAMLLVSVGLIFLLKPEEPEPVDVVEVADFNRAPATIETGVAYVQTPAGDWKAAEAVPVDQWVKAGHEKFAIKLEGGSRAELEPESVFRISYAYGELPLVYLLRGDGVIDNAGVSYDLAVSSGDANFYAMPGSRLALACESDTAVLRSWSAPAAVRARVLTGDVLLWNAAQPGQQVPLRAGEIIEWKPSDLYLVADGETYYLNFATLFAGQFNEGADPVARKQFEFLMPRIAEFRHRVGEQRVEIEQIREMQFAVTTPAEESITLLVNETTLKVSTDGSTLTVTVIDPSGTVTYKKKSLEALKEAIGEHIAEMLAGVEIELVDGKYRLKGAHAEARGEGKKTVNVKINSQSKD